MAPQKHCYIFTILFLIALIPQITPRALPEASVRARHEQWMSDYGRRYNDAAEKEARYAIFKANAEYIDSVNNDVDKPYKLSLNQFADIPNDEFKSIYTTTYQKPPLHTKSASETTTFRYENSTTIPSSIDWRNKGAVTQIRDGQCGAWTFPAVDTVEGITKIKHGKLYRLSSQEIVDCISSAGGEDGCSGGMLSDAFDFIKQKGLTTESNYPSEDKTGSCDVSKEKEAVARISGYEYVPADDEEALMKAVAGQPVAVSVEASGPAFQFYASGVFTGKCGSTPDQGVTVVGYGAEQGKLKYWIIKNSWGTAWGEQGYMRLQRDVHEKVGLCGIAEVAMYPIIL